MKVKPPEITYYLVHDIRSTLSHSQLASPGSPRVILGKIHLGQPRQLS